MTPQEEALAMAFRLTFETPHGQQVLRAIQAQGFMHKKFPKETEHGLALAEGARRLALWVTACYEKGRDLGKVAEPPTRATSSLSGDDNG